MNQIFISYAKEDRPAVRKLYEQLKQKGFSAWLDVFDLRPGQDWQVEIKKAIKNSAIFLACLSNHAVSKRGFVQSELNFALRILDTIPEGEIYLIPIRLNECEVPSKLEHLQWVDYFEKGGPEKLFDALREYLGQSISDQATDTASGPLRFSSIRIDANDPNWGEGARDGSPFERPCSQYFRVVEFVFDADPLFDITVMNTGSSPVILTAVGIEVLTVCQRLYGYGIPTAAKIPKSDSYMIQMPNIRERMREKIGVHGYGPQEVREMVTQHVPDPVYLEPNAAYRYGLLLKDYDRHVPNWARIRMWASTDQGECRSAEIETFTL